MPDHATIIEMGPRDGLQNEATQIPTADKVALVDLLSDCGFTEIEVTSFVSPKWVPQMADAADIMAKINRRQGVQYTALTPNQRGLDAAIAAMADAVAVFASASEGFSQKNINCSIDESLARFAPVMTAAKAAGLPVRGYVSCITDCPYDGQVAPDSVARVTQSLIEMGCFEVSLGDTIGAATPDRVETLLDRLLQDMPASSLAGHFHDTNDMALRNIAVCLDKGLRRFDAAIAGLGGCPYAPGAQGNVATEDVVQMLSSRGIETGIDTKKLAIAADFARQLVGRK